MQDSVPHLPPPLPAPASGRRDAAELSSLLDRRILVLDGGMGTSIQALRLGPEDFGGPSLDGCNEALNLTAPDTIRGISEGFLRAGADIIETNTFGGTPLVLNEYGLAARAYDINLAAARICRSVAAHYSTPTKPRFVAGALGPTTKTLSVTGGITFDEMVAHYSEQARGLVDGGVDLLLIETCIDTMNCKAAGLAVRGVLAEHGLDLPFWISASIETMGTMLAGQPAEAFYASTEHLRPAAIGLNCSTGPEFMTHHIRTLSDLATCRVLCYPNAGLPDEHGHFNETPEAIARKLERFAVNGWLNVVGGCCGTTPRHIQLIAEMAEGKAPRALKTERRLYLSGTDFYAVEEDNRPVLVGERANCSGSKKFRDLIASDQFEAAAEVGRKQVRGGAQVLDVNVDSTERNAVDDMVRLLGFLTRKVKVPLMLDSTDPKVFAAGLKLTQGKCILNSINLEDGEERFRKVVSMVREYGGAVVVGCIDERGQAISAQAKLEVARRSYDLLTRQYGLPPTDLIFDPLVFPCASGDKNYTGSAVHSIDAIRLIKEEFPDTHVLLGVSNVSFGLPTEGREVLNGVFLYHATKAGLDFAIVNPEKLERYASIPENVREAAEDLLFNRREDAVGRFAAIFREAGGGREKSGGDDTLHLPVEKRIARRVVEGTKEGLIDNLTLALQKHTPLEVINGPLMDGMNEVGRLFNDNQLIVAEVLESAEVMKAAVNHLETFMEKNTSAQRAKIVLATVKGDVHDIGKNLVEIIFANNGYRVVNLGIKVPSEVLIQAYREHQPDAIGLSGLLVKSAHQMVATASDFRNAGIKCPLFVGGAALSKKFAYTKIQAEYDGPVIYAREAMEGLDLANQWFDPAKHSAIAERIAKEKERLAAGEALVGVRHGSDAPAAPVVSKVRRDVPRPQPPDLKIHVLSGFALDEILPYVNRSMVYQKHLGLKGNIERLLEAGNAKARHLQDVVTYIVDAAQENGWIRPAAAYKFFPARGDGDDLVIYQGDGKTELDRFTFPRQTKGEGLCLSDYTAPVGGDVPDYVAMFVTTCGEGVREIVDRFKAEGEYVKCHVLQALAIECAEGFAELLHSKLRAMWGFPDPPELTMQERLQARYRGVRVSFGYPACPRLEDQEILWRLLEPEKHINVRLTEGYMMDPEASVSALVFHHPEGRYFGVDPEGVQALQMALAARRAT